MGTAIAAGPPPSPLELETLDDEEAETFAELEAPSAPPDPEGESPTGSMLQATMSASGRTPMSLR